MSKKRILLTGCLGQLGRAVIREYGDEADFLRTDFAEAPGVTVLDIADITAVNDVVARMRPDIIINCAAMTNVDGCEEDEDGAFRANAIGPRNLAIAAEETGAKLIHISTDYVFSGEERERPYTEFDVPAPLSAYGRSKLAGEEFVKQFCPKSFILRTAWLYGEGRNFVKTMLMLSESHDEVSVVCDQKGSPTSAAELARMIRYLEPTQEYGTYHATCEGDTNWADFTEEIFRIAGRETRVNHVTSEEYAKINPAAANRPKYSILDNSMLRLIGADFHMAHWQEAFMDYMDSCKVTLQ